MKKNFGRVSRNESEDIRVSLTEIRGELFVELRVYSRSARHGAGSQAEPEGIVVPVHAVSELCQLLEQTHNHIFKEGLVNVPTLGNLIVTEEGDAITLRIEDPPTPGPDVHRKPRLSARLPAECYSLGAPNDWPSQQVMGTIGDLSIENAQVWLPREFAVGSRLAVLINMNVRELTFRGQAEVVETVPQPPDGYFQHSIRWVDLNPQAKTTLAKIVESTGHPGS